VVEFGIVRLLVRLLLQWLTLMGFYEVEKETGGADILVCPIPRSLSDLRADKNVCPTNHLDRIEIDAYQLTIARQTIKPPERPQSVDAPAK
jgi:hypothetical protein